MDGDAKARERAVKRMKWVDSLSPELRACVHEYGMTVVMDFMNCGVTKAKHIHHLVESVRRGSMEIGKRTDSSPIAAGRAPAFYWTTGVSQ